ncbi:homocysteine S-methyltransferase family protein [Treponema sp.]|uniref:homocysteine S-methyltransferase family protein n=1 Tax=Treponema sp. TaxID=166 RepID=UPI00298EA6EA|nr:homocysteine S-methyltransferase family protein [Treponema sp.]MCQ2240397.1 homocysteine S-methyltransferase family protein [Treponema sp.]
MADFRKFLADSISNRTPVFFDGGMGTMIQKTGVVGYTIPEDLNFYHPEIIKDIHRQYLEAGANVITANSFGANPIKVEGGKFSAEQYINEAIKLQKEVIAEFETAHPETKGTHFCSWDSGQIGKLLEPMGTLTFDEAYEAYKLCAVTAEKAGADVAIIETMSDLYEVKAAILAVQENTKLPVVSTMTFQSNLRTLTGADVLTCVTYLESLHVDVIGFNCGGSLDEDEKLAEQFCSYAHLPVLAQPNAGLPVVVNGKDVFKVEPEEFSKSQLKNFAKGITLLGGCCGTTPGHIKAVADKIKAGNLKIAQTTKENENNTYICSYNLALQVGGSAGPRIIGERINPTGKKKCKEALQNKDMNFILGEAESQINGGAHILDVNTGLPGIDESEMMTLAVKTIQAAFNTPLQLDSSEDKVLEHALRYYNGKALVNSVNGKKEVMGKVLPLIKHYGGALVALCIDEDGIAPTAEGRVKVAEKIIAEAAKYGIPVRDIFIDTLTLTVSSEQKAALETVKAIRILKEKYGAQGIQFVLGVSNISFGLPRRDIINSRFFELALDAGLSAAIINPASAPMMDSYRAYRSLAGYDENCLEYIETYTGTVDPTTAKAKEKIILDAIADGTISISVNTPGSTAQNVTPRQSPVKAGDSEAKKTEVKEKQTFADKDEDILIKIIEKGFKDQAGDATDRLLETKKPVEIIDNCIVPALDNVGKDFEKGRKFLPQLLLSAETVSNSFAKIKENLEKSGNVQESKGTVVIATVFGDIHDIGKNIVKAMLENYGYDVIDLGKNVPAEEVVKTVLEKDIKLVGLSALMTTTVANMEETIRQLRSALAEKGKECKIVVGGAVLTEDYAEKIGADYYSKDAMQTVAVAKEVFGK